MQRPPHLPSSSPTRRIVHAAAGVCAVIMLACGGGSRMISEEPLGPKPVWPAAPEHARIQFVNSFSQSPGHPSKGFFASVLDFLFGSRDRDLPALKKPSAVAVDSLGNLYATDLADARIYRIPPDGTVWEPISIDAAKYFGAPVGLAVSGDTIYVVDGETGNIVLLRRSGDVLNVIHQEWKRPTAIALAGRELFVVDALSCEVVVLDHTGALLRKFGVRGQTGNAMNTPTNIAIRGDTIFVVDAMNFRVAVFTTAGTFVRDFGVQGDAPGAFSRPRGIAVDPDGHLFVVDGLQDMVQVFSSKGDFLLAFGSSGAGDPGRFSLPAGIAISNIGRIFVADSYNHRVQVFQYLQ